MISKLEPFNVEQIICAPNWQPENTIAKHTPMLMLLVKVSPTLGRSTKTRRSFSRHKLIMIVICQLFTQSNLLTRNKVKCNPWSTTKLLETVCPQFNITCSNFILLKQKRKMGVFSDGHYRIQHTRTHPSTRTWKANFSHHICPEHAQKKSQKKKKSSLEQDKNLMELWSPTFH